MHHQERPVRDRGVVEYVGKKPGSHLVLPEKSDFGKLQSFQTEPLPKLSSDFAKSTTKSCMGKEFI
jgi:hypothetical protein